MTTYVAWNYEEHPDFKSAAVAGDARGVEASRARLAAVRFALRCVSRSKYPYCATVAVMPAHRIGNREAWSTYHVRFSRDVDSVAHRP